MIQNILYAGLDRAFNFTLGLGPVGGTGAWPKAIVSGQFDQLGVVDYLAFIIFTQHSRLHPTIKNLLWYTTELGKDIQMTTQDDRQVLAGHEPPDQITAKAQDQAEQPDHAQAIRLSVRQPTRRHRQGAGHRLSSHCHPAGPCRQRNGLTEGMSPASPPACCSRAGSGRTFFAPGVGIGVQYSGFSGDTAFKPLIPLTARFLSQVIHAP